MQRKFKLLGSEYSKFLDDLRPGDILIGEDGSQKRLFTSPIKRVDDRYLIEQSPYGDSYTLSKGEYLALQVIKGPSIQKLRGGEIIVEGITESRSHRLKIPASFYQENLAHRTCKDFLQLGHRFVIQVEKYLVRSEYWKSCVGGYFSPVVFEGHRPGPFDPKDVPYLRNIKISKRYTEGSRKVRLELFRGYTDVYAKEINGDLIFRAPREILDIVKNLAKSLGVLVEDLNDELKIFIITSIGVPRTAYPIKVKYLGVHEVCDISFGEQKINVLLEDLTIAVL
jgi:hypothetical protein